ncbi:uncharacterized protein LOC132738088 [Ruditapes philippinarum]|uniref:uncharacterized protein LOC132738088 n=1 Tax=Ruditapes philippinarum TaxID=129788 RepID=UPI00295B885B|nr:uncharacterized protein LOC132738088 [Ruditapes philippinarum]
MQFQLLLLILPILGASGASFTCYKCSYEKLYNVNEFWNQKACMDDPASLGASAHVVCNSTSYCTYQEMYDTNRKVVTSYFRSCGTSQGNKCIQDWDHVTCSGSCRGNFCNRNETGTHYQIHFG